ncbi:MAG TPA: hypothetical protein VFV49_13015 [Thermoanaerobaculia bacterium]|nr:hypothetical protein [Thermoanaerobaculia bacterium]
MRRFAPIALFVALALASFGPIRNYDFFWHLATGRWIAEHHALPLTDPFAVASDRHPWINGEWLFEVVAHATHAIVGLAGMSVVRALLAASIFTLIFFRSQRDLLVTAIAFAGAMQTFDLRPSSVALLFVVLAITAKSWIAHAILTVLWINIHPSAILAPGIAALSTRRAAPVIASALVLFVNPFGWRALIAPLELMSYVRSGAFVNAEWLPSRVTQFPLLYLCVLAGALAFIVRRNVDDGKEERRWWRVLLFAGFAFLAIRHVRNQGLFFVAFPLLIPRIEVRRSLAIVVAAAAIALVAFTRDHRPGVAPERFPLQAVARLKATGLPGNIYNPDQFGGVLIWSFYPERRTLTDGRNELYRTFIPEYARARRDQRAWRALLAKYRIDLAVDEYRAPLPVRDAATGAEQRMPASLAYWPREQWALIGYDQAGMVFARRAAYAPAVIEQWEMRGVVPDAR